MTAEQIYELALAYLYEYKDKDKDYKAFFLPFLNVLLCECLPYENAEREANGKEILSETPTVADMKEIVPFAEHIVRIALPYGIASLYYQDEDDTYKMERYRNLFVNSLEERKPCVKAPIEDVY